MREKLIELLKEIYPKTRYIPMEECREKTADYLIQNGVVIIQRGKWANSYSSGTHLYRCTECGEYIEAIWTGGYDFKYCPNCGARMDGGVE